MPLTIKPTGLFLCNLIFACNCYTQHHLSQYIHDYFMCWSIVNDCHTCKLPLCWCIHWLQSQIQIQHFASPHFVLAISYHHHMICMSQFLFQFTYCTYTIIRYHLLLPHLNHLSPWSSPSQSPDHLIGAPHCYLSACTLVCHYLILQTTFAFIILFSVLGYLAIYLLDRFKVMWLEYIQ